jgi:dipeptide transport system permease protein
MFRFLLKRAALTLPTFFALMFVTFTMIRLVPGDPIEVRRGERGISPERLAELRHEMGLDQPIWKQFFDYVWLARRFWHQCFHLSPMPPLSRHS